MADTVVDLGAASFFNTDDPVEISRLTRPSYDEEGLGYFFADDGPRPFIDEEGYPLGFEHARLGEEGGTGGLWFDGTHLVDYDGVYNLPKGVIEICEHIGFNMDYAKDDNYEGVEQ